MITQRLKALRELLKREGLAAFIIPSADPHLSEYVAPHWKTREWISGFDGSAGTVVVTAKEAGLWTDSRYFLQAEAQLVGTEIKLFKEGLPETPSITTWLCRQLEKHDLVGIDGDLFSYHQVRELENDLDTKEIRIYSKIDPFRELWERRPPMPMQPAFVYSDIYAGESAQSKIKRIRKQLLEQDCKALLLSSLDEIAWTLNLRGEDVRYNPVVISYLLIYNQKIILFIDPFKITDEVKEYLKQLNITIRNYKELHDYLNSKQTEVITIDLSKTSYAIATSLTPAGRLNEHPSPVGLFKSIKNEQEIAGTRSAMEKDGVALVRFLRWLEENVPTLQVTELTVDTKLSEFRAAQPLSKGDSFDTIAGYKDHAAIIHYSATPESSYTLKPEGFLLLDSGGQYLDGTTDITRTIALGALTDEEKRDYTTVLKGHINLSSCIYPKGTRGAQLDVLARSHMWKDGINYFYGTGHGVGHFLNVHEGPQSIRMNENPTPLIPGMITSNEPGIYKVGSHGIRIENLLLTIPHSKTDFGEFYSFEALTLCPICTKGIIREMLTQEEIQWLNDYHRMVFDRLSPLLNKEEIEWLCQQTSAI